MQEPDYSELKEFTGTTLTECIQECNIWCKEYNIIISGMYSSKVPIVHKGSFTIDNSSSISNTIVTYNISLIISYTKMKSI